MLTIVIPTISFSPKLVRAIQSAVAIGNDTKVVILDNSVNGIDKYLTSAFDLPFPFEVISNEIQLDMADNWNKCFEISLTKYTLMLHDDDYLAENIDLSFLATNADLYILEGLLLKNKEITKLGCLDKIPAKNLLLNSLVQFPGVQRQVWKTSKIKDNKFCSEHFPILDYIWYSRQIDDLPKVEYSKGLKTIIEYHEEQTTQKIFWSLPVAKVLFVFLFKKHSYRNPNVYDILIKHLYDRLKKSIYIDVYKILKR